MKDAIVLVTEFSALATIGFLLTRGRYVTRSTARRAATERQPEGGYNEE